MTILYSKTKKTKLKELSSPSNYIKHIGFTAKLPKKAILCPIRSLVKYVENHTKFKKYHCEADIYVLENKDCCFVANFGVGAPAMAMALEVLIAAGVKEFIFLGLAGSLQPETLPGDIVLCDKALIDEGVSFHYIKPQDFARPSPALTQKAAAILQKNKINFHTGPAWTTDSIFRETKEEVAHYQKKNILAVEMETSAFFAICQYRKAKAAALYVISDSLANLKWETHFGEKIIFKNLELLFQQSLEILK